MIHKSTFILCVRIIKSGLYNKLPGLSTSNRRFRKMKRKYCLTLDLEIEINDTVEGVSDFKSLKCIQEILDYFLANDEELIRFLKVKLFNKFSGDFSMDQDRPEIERIFCPGGEEKIMGEIAQKLTGEPSVFLKELFGSDVESETPVKTREENLALFDVQFGELCITNAEMEGIDTQDKPVGS
jgi:hypothetical protein